MKLTILCILAVLALFGTVRADASANNQLIQQALKNGVLQTGKLDTSRFLSYSAAAQIKLSRKVDKTTNVNGHPLAGDVVVTASDAGAPSGSGTSTGANTGDVTLATANGLSLAGQAISLQVATNLVPGAMSAADHLLLSTALQSTVITGATDYTDSTWTPVLTFATPGNLSVSYLTQSGSYVRVGKMITCCFNISTSAFTWTTAAGALQITGLPFTSRAATGLNAYGGLRWQGITKASYTSMVPEVASANSYIRVLTSGSGQAVAAIAAADMPSGGTVQLLGTVTYLIP
jgi:hypothetical protein